MEKDQYEKNVVNPKPVADLHATVLETLGIDFGHELITPIGRPMVLSRGHVIHELLKVSHLFWDTLYNRNLGFLS